MHRDLQLREGTIEEPCYDREVTALVVRWNNDRVLVIRSHCDMRVPKSKKLKYEE